MITTTSFHVSNFGAFGGNLPRDMDGYCHLTAEAWLAAPVDWGSEDPCEEMAEQLAAEARAAVRDAERLLADWQDEA